MLRTDAARALRERRTEDGHLLPDYGGACFAGLPATVADLLDADAPGTPLPDHVLEGVRTEGVETVCHVLVDGFGFEQWRRHRHAARFLDRLTERARVSPLTSIYPSETAAALTTLHTGRLPAEHGLLGWNQYLPDDDLVVQTLPFLAADDTPAADLGVDPDDLFDDRATPVYDRFADAGVASHVLAPAGINDSAYGGVTLGGAATHDYDGLDGEAGFDGRLGDALDAAYADAPAYLYAYLPQMDAVGHEVGTRDPAYAETAGRVFRALRRALAGVDDAVARETLLVVSADHGHVDTDPETNVDLFADDRLPDALRTDRRGAPLVCGGPRNVHLFPRPGESDRVRAALDDRGVDCLREPPDPAVDRTLFGGGRSATFETRRGPLLVVPDDRTVWYEGTGDLASVGMHGGLHPAEGCCPFAAVRLDRLFG